MSDKPGAITPDEFKTLRKELGFTQAQLAAQLGLEENSVWRLENGASPIRVETALALRFLVEARSNRRLSQLKQEILDRAARE